MFGALRAKLPQVPFTFVDLFAGIGGFHAAMSEMGGKCVFASEIDYDARSVYERNWHTEVAGDIVPLTEQRVRVPKHDVLCAGFPCQPFSKSGKQLGMDEARGTLFWNIARVIEKRQPELVLLENVRNIAGPRHRREWAVITRTLRDLGYAVSDAPIIFSPHWLSPERGGTPQVRERVFIVGWRVGTRAAHRLSAIVPAIDKGPVDGWDPLDWDLVRDLPLQDDSTIENIERYRLSTEENYWIDVWNDFLDVVDCEKLPGFPIWADDLQEIPNIPSGTPAWKRDFLEKNARFYRDHHRQIDAWKERHDNLVGLPPSRRKLEWQAQDTERDLRRCVLHFRPSGIRAKRGTYLPALVAITQTSVIGSRGRRITPGEAARLQGFPDTFDFGEQPDALTYRQLGNAVAVGAVQHVFATARATDPRDLLVQERLAMDLGGVSVAA